MSAVTPDIREVLRYLRLSPDAQRATLLQYTPEQLAAQQIALVRYTLVPDAVRRPPPPPARAPPSAEERAEFFAARGFDIDLLPEVREVAHGPEYWPSDEDIVNLVGGIPGSAQERARMIAMAMELRRPMANADDTRRPGEEDSDVADSREVLVALLSQAVPDPESLAPEERFLVPENLLYPGAMCADTVAAVVWWCTTPHDDAHLATAFVRIIAGHRIGVALGAYDDASDAEEMIFNGAVVMRDALRRMRDAAIAAPITEARQLEASLLAVMRDDRITGTNRMFVCVHVLALLADGLRGHSYATWPVSTTGVTGEWMRSEQSPVYAICTHARDGWTPGQEPTDVVPVTGVDLIVRGGFIALVAPFLTLCLHDLDVDAYMRTRAAAFTHTHGANSSTHLNVYHPHLQFAVCAYATLVAAVDVDDPTPVQLQAARAVFAHAGLRALSVASRIMRVRAVLRIAPRTNAVVRIVRECLGLDDDEPEPVDEERRLAWASTALPADFRGSVATWRIGQRPIDDPYRQAVIHQHMQVPFTRTSTVRWRRTCRLMRVQATGDPLDFVVGGGATLDRIVAAAALMGTPMRERVERVKRARTEMVNVVATTTAAFRRALPDSIVGMVHSMVSRSVLPHTELAYEKAVVGMAARLDRLVHLGVPDAGPYVPRERAERVRLSVVELAIELDRNPRMFADRYNPSAYDLASGDRARIRRILEELLDTNLTGMTTAHLRGAVSYIRAILTNPFSPFDTHMEEVDLRDVIVPGTTMPLDEFRRRFEGMDEE